MRAFSILIVCCITLTVSNGAICEVIFSTYSCTTTSYLFRFDSESYQITT